MHFDITQPSLILKPYIKQYWALNHIVNIGEEYTQRIIPSGLPELIFYLQSKPQAFTKNRVFEDTVLLSGQQNDYYDILITDSISIFSIVFQPQGISQFFELPISELFNNNIPLKYINKSLYSDLEIQLATTNSFETKIEIVENAFIKLLHKSNRAYEFNRITHVVEHIKNTRGNIDINSLAELACLSRKQFERTFAEFIGTSPKQYLKTIRLQASIYTKSRDNSISLTDLAYKHGYFDQSHFINDYKIMTGLTPKHFFEDCEKPMSDFFE